MVVEEQWGASPMVDGGGLAVEVSMAVLGAASVPMADYP